MPLLDGGRGLNTILTFEQHLDVSGKTWREHHVSIVLTTSPDVALHRCYYSPVAFGCQIKLHDCMRAIGRKRQELFGYLPLFSLHLYFPDES
jgi:hypothetical protein